VLYCCEFSFSHPDNGESDLTIFRIKDAAIGFLVGIVLFFGSFFFAFAIERFAVQKWLITGRAQKACVPNVSSSAVNSNLNRRVIHTTGKLSAEDSAKDSELNFSPDQKAVVLRRNVEILHWREERITEKESTTYKYHLEWTEKDIDSSDFKEKAGHENPHRSISLKSKTFHAVTHLGAYKLSAQCLDKLKRWHVSELTAANTAGLSPLITQPGPGSSYTGLRDGTRPTRVEGQAQARGEAYWSSIMDETKDLPRKFAYVRRETAAAAVATDVSGAYGATGSLGTPGDVRVSYDLILEGDASVVGVLQEGTFRAYTERDAHTVSGLLEEQLIPGDDGKDGDAAAGDGTGLFEQIFRLVMQSPSGSTALLLVEERAATADQLFADETAKFRTRLSILRLACYIALSLGIYLMLNPIAELLSFLPFVDGLLKSLFFIVALLVGLVLWSLAVAVAWSGPRPPCTLLTRSPAQFWRPERLLSARKIMYKI
jgi:hypothetical protein